MKSIIFENNVIFDFKLDLFLAFFIGLFVGLAFSILIYLLLALNSLKKERRTKIKINTSISKEEIEKIIFERQKKFKELKKKEPIAKVLKKTLVNLIIDIAKKYYPKSKHPVAELTIYELIKLDKYIADTLDELLSKNVLRLLKPLKLSTILNIADASSKIKKNKTIEITKKYKLDKIIKASIAALNLINPFYWFKKLIVSPSFNLLLNKLFITLISVVGIKTYMVYSKQIFIDENETMENIIQELEEKDNKKLIDVK